jgi:D-alanyl-D-alanine endopeptidase (penicillin-binding protein 7)
LLNDVFNSIESIRVKIRISIFSLFFAFTGLFITQTATAQETIAPPRDTTKLQVASGSAILLDLQTDKVVYSSNPDVVVPIASVTKLMTGLIVLDAKQNLDEYISISIANTPEMKGVFSRVKLNSELSRRDVLLIALMSSENRAAASLAHHYPGGYAAFIAAMNAKAKALGMSSTHYVEPTGLSAAERAEHHQGKDRYLPQARLQPGLSQHRPLGPQGQLGHSADQDRFYQ